MPFEFLVHEHSFCLCQCICIVWSSGSLYLHLLLKTYRRILQFLLCFEGRFIEYFLPISLFTSAFQTQSKHLIKFN